MKSSAEYAPIATGTEAPQAALCGGRIPGRIWGFKTTNVALVVLACAVVGGAVGGGVGGWLAGQKKSSESGGRIDECSWESYRLPSSVVPVHYDVAWDLSRAFAPPFSFSGSSAVAVNVSTVSPPVRCVLLHARALDLNNVSVVTPGGSPMPVTAESDPYPQSDRIIIRLPDAAIGATALTLRFGFAGILSTTVIGFYGSSYMNGSASVPIVQTKFEPSFARTAFPCFDEPALKATFNLFLTGVPEGYVALGNMPVLGGSSTGGITAFERSPVMSTYQLTAVVAPMVSIATTMPPTALRPSPLPVAVWAVDRGPATPLAALAANLATAVSALSFYEATFGISYALPKTDLVYLPVFPVGAMEQWGLITFTESYLARNASIDASPSSVVAHELAHQWFGNLVTAAWWDALWLQEGFATFWPEIFLAATAPSLAPDGDWRLSTQGAMEDDGYAASQALTVATPIVTAGEGYAVFGSITYDKGAAVVGGLARRVEAVLPGSFLSGLNAYLTSHSYGAAVPADLTNALAESAGLPGLPGEFEALIFLPGVPLLRVEYSGGELALSISRFFVGPESAELAAAAGQALAPWTSLPLAISAATPSPGLAAVAASAAAALGGALGGSALPATLPYNPTTDGWVVVTNGSAVDYVRVLYPPVVYAALAAALAGGVPPPALGVSTRAALIDDLFAAAEARTTWGAGGSSSVNMTYALTWAASWAGAEQDPYARASLASRLRRLNQLLVDDVPLASAGDPAVSPRASLNGTAEYACIAALRSYAASLGVTLARQTTNRSALAASLAAPLDAANASNVLLGVAGNPYGRDIAWAAFKSETPAWLAWYGYRSTLGGIARGLAVNFHSTEYADDETSVWTGLGASASAAAGSWQRGVERIVAGAGWAAADGGATCAFLVSGWGDSASQDAPGEGGEAAEGTARREREEV